MPRKMLGKEKEERIKEEKSRERERVDREREDKILSFFFFMLLYT